MRTKLVTFLAVLSLTGPLSCGLFDTRDPVEPSGSQFPCLTLTTPDNVVLNIRQAYGHPDGLGCYVSTLADFVSSADPGFKFHPDPTDSLEDTADSYANWTKSIEERVAANIANSARQDSFRLTLQFQTTITDQPDLVIRQYSYEIRFNDTAPTNAIPDSVFQGLAELSIRRTSGQWQITDWFDKRDPGGTTTRTWGYLRAGKRTGF